MDVKRSITIRKPVDEVFGYWRHFEQLPTFMIHLRSVTVTGDKHTRWEAEGPAGRSVSWEADITEERPNELIAWRATGSSPFSTSGRVTFNAAPGDQGTEVHVDMQVTTPVDVAGPLAGIAARVLGEHPDQQVSDDLRRLKQILETGEVVRSEGQLTGAVSRHLIRQHSAQPPTTDEQVAAAAEEASKA